MEGKNSYGFEFNSFDRFGDDLCELILNYLKINDKIVLESLSKQWQRLIFNKQKSLSMTNHYKSENLVKNMFNLRKMERIGPLYNTRYRGNNEWFYKIKMLSLKKVFKSFKFIKYFDLGKDCKIDSHFIGLIADNCHRLKKFISRSKDLKNLSINSD
jgi:hypothetical protein